MNVNRAGGGKKHIITHVMQQQKKAGQKKRQTVTQRGNSNGDAPQQDFDQPEEHLEEAQEQPDSPEQQTSQRPQKFGWKKDISILKDKRKTQERVFLSYSGCFDCLLSIGSCGLT